MIKTRVFEPWFENTNTPLQNRAMTILAIVIGSAVVIVGVCALF